MVALASMQQAQEHLPQQREHPLPAAAALEACGVQGFGQPPADHQPPTARTPAPATKRHAPAPACVSAMAAADWPSSQAHVPASKVAKYWVAFCSETYRPAALRRRRFQQEGGGRPDFAAQREALQQAEQHHQQRRDTSRCWHRTASAPSPPPTRPSGRTTTAWRACAPRCRPGCRSPPRPAAAWQSRPRRSPGSAAGCWWCRRRERNRADLDGEKAESQEVIEFQRIAGHHRAQLRAGAGFPALVMRIPVSRRLCPVRVAI